MSSSINIDHSNSSIISSNGDCLILNNNGSVLVGNGTNLPETQEESGNINLSDYAGAIRFNRSSLKMEYCDGEQWLEFATYTADENSELVYSFLF